MLIRNYCLTLLNVFNVVCDAVGRVIQTLPEREPVWGVTTLNDRLYVLRGLKSEEQIEVYDIDSYRLLNYLHVPGLGHNDAYDIVACTRYRCAYISDLTHDSVHRVSLSMSARDATEVTQWPVNDRPALLSLTYTHGVLVSCWTVRKIKEFSTHGDLLHVLTLQDVVTPWHTIQLSSGQFLVCAPGDPVHPLCVTSSDGSVVKSFDEPSGPSSPQMNLMPFQMAVDRNGFVFVVHQHSDRVSLLSPRLTFCSRRCVA